MAGSKYLTFNMIFPQSTDKKYRVSHVEEYGADIIDTRNLDFSKEKYISTQNKPIVLFTNTDDSNYANLLSVVSTESLYYFVTSDGIYSSNLAFPTAPTELTTTSRPNIRLNTDAVAFGGNLVVSGDNSVGYYDGSWHSGVTGLSTSYPHPLCVYETGTVLAVGNGNTVTTYNTGYALQNTLTIPVEYVVTAIRARSNNLYIATRNISGGGAKLFIWNGTTTGAQYFYGVAADWMYSICEYNNSIAVITSAGQLLYYNGGGFDELANLPVYGTPYSWSSSNAIASGIGKVANRGMIAKGKNLYINIDGSITIANSLGYPGLYMAGQPSGLWEYIPTKGLSHVAGYPHSKYQTITIGSVTASELDFSGIGHGCETGDAVYVNVATGLVGITNQQTYYAIKASNTSLKLALTPADANAGSALTITGSPSSASVCVEKLDSLGATLIVNPGAIGLINTVIPNNFFGSKLIFGGQTKDSGGNNAYVLLSLGLGRSRGNFVTIAIESQELTDEFKNVYISTVNLSQAVDSIHVKYKTNQTVEYPTMSSAITWTSGTVFTATTSSSVDFANVQVGDEIYIIQGAGSGYTAHITTIVPVGTTYTVTLDEAIPLIASGNTSLIVVDNWTALATTISTTSPLLAEEYGHILMGKQGSWSKLKVELRGIYITMGRLALTTTPKKSLQ